MIEQKIYNIVFETVDLLRLRSLCGRVLEKTVLSQ